MSEQTDANGLHDFESYTEDSTNSYGDDTPQIIAAKGDGLEFEEEVVIVKIS